MPTPVTAKWPRPKSGDEWEDMVLDAMKIRWDDLNAFRYGRNGQKQNGVDIVGKRGLLNVAAQAKNRETLSKQVIESDIKKVENLYIKVDEFYFVISGERDVKLQELINGTSTKHKSEGGFEVFIIFFEEVCQYLALRSELVKKYWHSFFDSLSQVFKRPILNEDEAIDEIFNLKEYKSLQEQTIRLSSGTVNLIFRIEGKPDLGSNTGSIDRSWQIAVSENHDTHLVTLWRFAINVDDGSIYFLSILDGKWIPRDQWKNEFPGL